MLIGRGLISNSDLDKALTTQRQSGMKLGRLLVRLGALSEESLLPVLAEHLGMPLLDEAELQEHADAIVRTIDGSGLGRNWFADQALIAFEAADGVIHCVTRQPNDAFLQETVGSLWAGHAITWHLGRSRDAEWLEKLLHPVEQAGALTDEVAHLRELAEETPVIDLVNGLLAQAADEGASDIHIEPEEREFFVRLRIDGVLQTRLNMPFDRFPAVASRIKLISGLDIAERRLPQDGRISLRAGGVEMDVRVSVLPGVHGESIVMRLLPKDRGEFDLARLGMEPDHLQQFMRWIKEPHGIVLVTGPTGSGKSTTLYAGLAAINDRTSKIITVEDPVEYRMKGITQIQTQAEIGYTFGRALRAILRQDPDIIMIGEIRDLETAEIAVQSSLTGHMVFSTLHTNDSVAAFSRLIDMGVEPFLVASSVRAVEAQRLARRLCDHCAAPADLPDALAPVMEELSVRFGSLMGARPALRQAVGCPECGHTGYRGRLGLYELVDMSPALQSAIMQRQSAHDMVTIARRSGFRNLREDGLIKVWRGQTSLDEVLRVTGLGGEEGA